MPEPCTEIVSGWATEAKRAAGVRARGAYAWAALHKVALAISVGAAAFAGVASLRDWVSPEIVGLIALCGAAAGGVLAAFDPNGMRSTDWKKHAEWLVFEKHCSEACQRGPISVSAYEELQQRRDALLLDV